MRIKIIIFLLGLLAGTASWAVVSIVSDKFEPFDSSVGYYTGQLILSVLAFLIGYNKRIIYLFLYLLAAHLGMNIYAYVYGGPEQRAWAGLGMMTTLVLLIYPLLFGLLGKLLCFGKGKYDKRLKKNTADQDIY